MTRKKFIFIVVIILIVAAMAFWIYGNFMRMIARYQVMGQIFGEQQIVPVQAARIERRDLVEYHDFTATTSAVDSVEIRARVEGYLQDIHFEDGSDVEKGQVLFTIEPSDYTAARDQAASRLNAAEAELERAKLDYERIRQAVQANAVSQQELSRSQAAFRTAQAAVTETKAALERAELQLSYTEIRSPISGKAGRHLVDAGNLVSSGGTEKTLLTTVVDIDPIYVIFYASERWLQQPFLNPLLSASPEASVTFMAGLSTEQGYPHEGRIGYIDNRVDPMTGTILVRGVLPNANRTLLPGMFMRVRVPGEVRKNAILVQEEAIITDLNGKFLLVIGEDNVLQRRSIQLGLSRGKMREITQGLTGNEAYVLSGQHKGRAGSQVEPHFGSLPTNPAENPQPSEQGNLKTGSSEQ
jgi:RND family efflux transporter MFP subunit